MPPVYLALYWHQHQPYYPDDVGGETILPWVRMHGVKDYWGMAMLLQEFPEVRCTINLVPSLIVQLLAYSEGAEDKHLRISRIPAQELSREDVLWLLDNGFLANRDRMIGPQPRYDELYRLRGFEVDSAERALKRFGPRELRDLQVWSNLCWIHPLAFEQDRDLAELRQKGWGYNEQEKQWVLDKQRELLGQIMPLHRKLEQEGQVELTTSPFYHPILPLLWDKALAREAMPDVPLPRYRASYPEDAAWHIEEAVRCHEEIFGSKPRGMWPSEGSVCPAMIPKLAQSGIGWTASDEGVLSQSLGGRVGRDQRGFVQNCELLYRPWRASQDGYEVDIIFRDHALSDLIGFEYYRISADLAAEDFLAKLRAIGRATEQAGPALVSVILDGENCWEYYPNEGVDLLRQLYGQLAGSTDLRTTRVSEYLAEHPPAETLPSLFSGSWINHNFAIWIGHDEDRRAWDRLDETREYLKRQTARGAAAPERLAQAWRELYIAEGSDWFWWFGDVHQSPQDTLFDHLFRKHLQNVYILLDDLPPPELSQPISLASREEIHTDPLALLDVRVDGRFTYFEWVDAGQHIPGSRHGTMRRVSSGLIEMLHFGFDTSRLLLRIDFVGPANESLSAISCLRVEFLRPAGYALVVSHPGEARPAVQLLHRDRPVDDAAVELGIDRVVEIALPWLHLGAAPDDLIHFFVELNEEQKSLDRAPREGLIALAVPSPDFERIMWQV